MKILAVLCMTTFLMSQEIKVESVASVYDGDTFKVNLSDCNIDIFCKEVPVRVYGIDTAEKKGTVGAVHDMSLRAKEVTVQFLKDDVILEDCQRDKYFRILCKVKNKNNQYLSELLLQMGLAKPYFGGTKEGF